MSALLEAREWTASAPTGRIFTLKGASIIQLEGKKTASDHAHFYRRAVDEPLGTSDIRKDSIKTRRLINLNNLKPYGRRSCTERGPEFPLPPASKLKDGSSFTARTTGALRIDSDVRNMR
jgi:hypothetical protein